MAKGGARPGAGKPKGYKAPHTLEAQEARKILIDRITARIVPLTDALISRAENGDIVALREALDRLLGKPQQHIDHTTKDQPIPIMPINVLSNDGDK